MPTIFGFVEAWDRRICFADVQNGLINGSISRNDEKIFFRNRTGELESSIDNPTLTLYGCEKICGSRRDWYPDAGPRLNTWLLPVVLLIANMEVSPLDKRRYLMVIHLMGDPIHSLWSMLAKLDAWDRIYASAVVRKDLDVWRGGGVGGVKIVATVLAGMEEIIGTRSDVEPLELFNSLIKPNKPQELLVVSLVQKTAFRLADSRSDEIIRTFFAVLLYIWQLVAAFITTLGGGNTSPPGGRIGTAMFITWLVPAILLSNAIGGFHSRTACFQIMADFDREARNYQSLDPPNEEFIQLLDKNSYLDDQNWSGAVYSYRQPKTSKLNGGDNGWRDLRLLLLAFAPILVSAIFGSAIIWETPPQALNCRNLMLIAMTIVWVFSSLITWGLSRRFSSKRAWVLVMIKDAIIAIFSLLMISLSSAGLYNSCSCWSGRFSLGARAHIPLNTDGFFAYDDSHLYRYLVGVCIGLQIAIFGCMIVVNRKGFAVMRWNESEKRHMFTHLL